MSRQKWRLFLEKFIQRFCEMRRVLVVLLLTLIILPFAFAESVLGVTKVVTTVTSVAPVFQFEFTSGMEDKDAVTSVTAREQSQDLDADAVRPPIVFVPDIRLNDLDLLFTAKLANDAKCYGSYTLTFKAGSFAVVRDGISGVLAPVAVEAKVAEDIASLGGIQAANIRGSNSIEMSFTGNTCSAGALATFEIRYEADSELDPATYYTDISLEVSSNN